MKKTKRKLRWMQFFSIFFLVAPIGGVICYNAPEYFKVQQGFIMPQYLEVSIGAILAISTGVLLVLGKTKPLKGSRGLLVGLALSIFLKTVLNDLILILAALSAGSLIHNAFQPKIADMKETFKYEKQANIQAKAMQNVMNVNKKRVEELDGSV